jgi:hypothetical protein
MKTELRCSFELIITIEDSSATGQAVGIYEVAAQAYQKLKSSVGVDFWNQPIRFIWPADGDYYSWGTVHITRGDHWDVVGHELGHAIYDLANVGKFGGGPHRIDECYSEALALSEGWASYFSAWVQVDLADPDARFEFMVPRRAPIRIENVPTDVCDGQTNEWRVSSFFWDLIDLNDDHENSSEAFAKIWNALLNSNSNNAREAARTLQSHGISEATLEVAWLLNFRRPLL